MSASESVSPRKRFRFLRSLLRLQLRDLFWMMLLAAILMTWYRDHSALVQQLSQSIRVSGESWSIRQLLGSPDTKVAGDVATAWASATQDGQQEWIVAEFFWSSQVQSVEILETYNPGAVTRVCSVSANGTETELWKGTDPTPPTAGMGRSIIPIPKGTRTRRVKIYLDSPAFAGWNEIDAIGLRDQDGSIQWAGNAWASSAYGDNQEVPSWFWP